MAKVITVTNRKGGVGKSTISSHIAAGLATRGYHVGLVDTDSQGHASLMLAMPQENGLYNLIVENMPLQNVLRLVPFENYSTSDTPAMGALYLLPSSDRTFRIPFLVDDPFIFGDKLAEMGEAYNLDVIIVDTNPTMSMFDGSIYLATDGFIYVTTCEKLAIDGVQKAITQMQRFGRKRLEYRGEQSRILGIVPNMVRPKTRNHKHNIRELEKTFPSLVWSRIVLDTIWAEATNLEQLMYTYVPSGIQADAAWNLVDQTERALEAWQTNVIS